MKFKDDSIGFQSLKPQLVLALIVVDQVMIQAGQEAMITSGNDARHSYNSEHYGGGAVDLRSKWFTNPEQVLALCKMALGNSKDFDMVYESKGLANEHFHLEYDPKRRE